MRRCITFPPLEIAPRDQQAAQLYQYMICAGELQSLRMTPKQLELQILRARTCLVTPPTRTQSEHKYFTFEMPLQEQQLSSLSGTQQYSEEPRWTAHFLLYHPLHHSFQLKSDKGQLMYTQRHVLT